MHTNLKDTKFFALVFFAAKENENQRAKICTTYGTAGTHYQY